MTTKLKAGDLIRTGATGNTYNGFKSGQVVEVVRLGGWTAAGSAEDLRYVLAKGMYGDGEVTQSLKVGAVKLAKQAMRKRAQYDARRG